MLESLTRALTAPDMKKVMARLIGTSGDHPELIATYWRTYMEPRRQAALRLLEDAQAMGQIPPAANVPVLLDVIAGVITYQVLVRPGERTADEVKSHLSAVLRELGIPGGGRVAGADPASPSSGRPEERSS
jgi:hypothetical protein